VLVEDTPPIPESAGLLALSNPLWLAEGFEVCAKPRVAQVQARQRASRKKLPLVDVIEHIL
jgi:hypothetical protein